MASAPCITCHTRIPARTHARRLRRPTTSETNHSAATAQSRVSATADAMLDDGATIDSTSRTTVVTTSASASSPTTTSRVVTAGGRSGTRSGAVWVVSGTASLQHRDP